MLMLGTHQYWMEGTAMNLLSVKVAVQHLYNQYKGQIFGAILTLALVTAAVVAVFLLNAGPSQPSKQLSIEDIVRGKFTAGSVRPVWLATGDYLYNPTTPGQTKDIWVYDVTSFATTSFINASSLILNGVPYGSTYFTFLPSSDSSLMLFGTNQIKGWRSSYFAQWIVYNVVTKQSFLLTTDNAANPVWNPADGSDSLAIVVDNNILLYRGLSDPASVAVENVTTDGSPVISNGIMDWLYEEEVFQSSVAHWWSPDGSYLAYLKLDDSLVGEVVYPWFVPIGQSPYPQMKTVRYPKAGTPNPVPSVFVYDVQGHSNTKMQLLPGSEYVTAVSWPPFREEQVAIRVLPRLQQVESLVLNNITSGAIISSFVTQNMTGGWVETRSDSIVWIDNDHFVDIRAYNDYYHVAYQDVRGGSNSVIFLTSGSFSVMKICGYDSMSRSVFFISTESSEIQRQVYKVSLSGRITQVSPNTLGSYSVSFGPGSAYILTGSSATVPPKQWVLAKEDPFTNDHLISDNQWLTTALSEYNMPTTTFFEVAGLGGQMLNGLLIEPKNTLSGVLYPVLFNFYQGPTSNRVVDSWSLSFNHWIAAKMKMKVVVIDGAGTGAKSISFNQQTYLRLGILETQDQLEAMDHVLSSMGGMDWNRVAVWGWSYGGFMAINTALHSRHILNGAISIAPVTDWRLYDTFYTERYMQTPQENEIGYNMTSMVQLVSTLGREKLSISNANRTSLYLIHGMADDNVHFQNAAEFVSSAVAANIGFYEAYYPNQDHAINQGGSLVHLYHQLRYFLKQNVIDFSFKLSYPEL